ncbi:MAG: hypothetical protein AAB264_04680, partial [Planctomycetota bacterium]
HVHVARLKPRPTSPKLSLADSGMQPEPARVILHEGFQGFLSLHYVFKNIFILSIFLRYATEFNSCGHLCGFAKPAFYGKKQFLYIALLLMPSRAAFVIRCLQ